MTRDEKELAPENRPADTREPAPENGPADARSRMPETGQENYQGMDAFAGLSGGSGNSLRMLLDKVLVWADVCLFAFMVLVGTYQILVRYLFNRPSTVSEELLTYTFAWMSLLAATYVFGQKGHMRMGFLADRLAPGSRWILGIGTECLTIAFTAVVMVYGGIRITTLTMTQKTASLGIPMGYIYGIVPMCGVLILVYNCMNLAEQIASGSGRNMRTAGVGTGAGREPVGRLPASQEPSGLKFADREPSGRLAAGREPSGLKFAGQEPSGRLAASRESIGREFTSQESAGQRSARQQHSERQNPGEERGNGIS